MRPLKVADLHIHTTASDGGLDGIEVARLAHSADLEIIAITDHDSVSAFDSFSTAWPVEVVPGVELSAYHDEREVHILGYFVDPSDASLRATLGELQKKRRARAFSIIRKLAGENVAISPDEVFQAAQGCSISRLHVAEVLIENGHSSNLYEAFRDFLGPDGSAFVAKPHFTVREAIEMIRSAGGAAVLAHPRSNFSYDEISSFVESGLSGIETYYPTHSGEDTTRCRRIADELGIVPTGGSDFHGRRFANTAIGTQRVERQTVEQLYERAGPNAVRRLS